MLQTHLEVDFASLVEALGTIVQAHSSICVQNSLVILFQCEKSGCTVASAVQLALNKQKSVSQILPEQVRL